MNTVPKPTLTRPGFALIKIHAASINPADVFIKEFPSALKFLTDSGLLSCLNVILMRPILNLNLPSFKVPLPFIPGYDFSGVIESVSSDVTSFSPGDEVFSMRWGVPNSHTDEFGSAGGAFAEYIAYPVAKLSRKPRNVTHAQAAAIAMVGLTGEVPMRMTNVKAGTRVLVLGGSSAVGSMAIQLAKLKG